MERARRRLPVTMTRNKPASAVIVLGLVCIGLGLVVGLHRVSREFTQASGFSSVQLSQRVTACGSVLAPDHPPRSFSFVTAGPLPARPQVQIQSCAAARHTSLLAMVGLLTVGAVSLLAAVVIALRRRRRPPDPGASGDAVALA
ncbi:MAG: hypothetical protein QOF35_1675 [Actinomycetota bacterium]|nr:hypothetical protein [Actinomycetota bacterium]